MTSIPHFASDASAHDVASALTTAGAAIIERLVPGSLVDELLGQMHPCGDAEGFGGAAYGRTIHGGGANRSEHVRRALNVDYVLGWLRQEENQYLSCPPAVARTLPRDPQKLAGYTIGASALGYVDDVRDP